MVGIQKSFSLLKWALLCLFMVCTIFVNAEQRAHKCIVVVDNSGGMQGFVKADASSAYAKFLAGMEARLGDEDMRLEKVKVLVLDGTESSKRLKDFAIKKWLYPSGETPLQEVFGNFPSWMKKNNVSFAFLITDNVMSVKASGGFDLPRLRASAQTMVRNVSNMGLVGVKSLFSGKYYAEFPKRNHLLFFPAANATSNQKVRPFYVYVIGTGDAGRFNSIFSNLCAYARKCADSQKGEVEKHIRLLPVSDARIELDPSSIPKAITIKNFPGSFFIQKGKMKFDARGLSVNVTYLAQDPVPMKSTDGKPFFYGIRFRQKGENIPSWIRCVMTAKPEIKWIQNTDAVKNNDNKGMERSGKALNPATYLSWGQSENALPRLHFFLFPISRECYGGNKLICDISYRIRYDIESEKNVWWEKWSTENDTIEPYNTLYLNRILNTLMQNIIEQHLSTFTTDGNLKITFEGEKKATGFSLGWLLWLMLVVAIGIAGFMSWKVLGGGDGNV